MIDLNVLNYVDSRMPRMDARIVEGISAIQTLKAEEYINDIFRCAAIGFPAGFKYTGGRRCTPMEQFQEITRQLKPTGNLKPTKIFDMARSDIYLMRYMFTWKGVELRPQHIFLPFVSPGGLVYLRDTQYKLTPALGGKVFNIEKGNIYMQPARHRIGFWQFDTSCIKDGKLINQSSVGSHLFVIKFKKDRSPLKPTLVHYILAEYGLTNTLRDFFNVTPVIGNEELDDYDKSKWTVYRSRQMPPIRRSNNDYAVSKIRIAIPIEQHYPILDNIISTIFYIIDNSVGSTQVLEDLDNPRLWLRLLDKFTFSVAISEQKLQERMQDHLYSMKNMFDPMTERTLLSDGIACKSIFEFFRYMCINYQDIIIHYDVGTMYDKELATLKYFLFGIVYSIFSLMYDVRNLTPELLTVAKLNKILGKNLKKEKILNVKGHGELMSASFASNCMMHGATCNMISHTKATTPGGKQKNKGITNDPGVALHPSQAEWGSYGWITGGCPTGRDKMNPFGKFNGWVLARNPELTAEIEELRTLIMKRRN